VVEEIRVSKDVEERDETIRDTVRDTEIDVDNTGRTGNRSDSDDLRTDLDSEGTNRKTGDY
jgi:stress response protein YsnF